MPTIRPVINTFAAGEISPRLAGRVDAPVSFQGAQELTNFQVKVLGGVSKRPGTKYVAGTFNNAKTRLIPFVIDHDTTFLIELTPSWIRIFSVENGAFLSNGGSPIALASNYTEAELYEIKYAQTYREMYLVHPNHPPIWFRYVSGTVTSAVIDYTASDQSFAGNLIAFTAPTGTYDASELWERVAQWLTPRKDYTATGTYNGKTLSKVSRTDLVLTLTFTDASTLSLNKTGSYSYQGSINIDLRPFIGAGNYPAAVAFFAGRLWMGGSKNDPAVIWGSKPWDYKNFLLFEEIEYKTSEKTESGKVGDGFTAAATYNGTSLTGISPAVTAGALVGKFVTGKYIAYGSKVLSNTTNSVVMDKVALGSGTASVDFSDWKDVNVPEYAEGKKTTQQVGAGSAIRLKLATEEDESIQWIATSQDLYVGTTSSEWIIPGTSNATQARAIIASRYGSANIQARFVGEGLMYVTSSSRHIRQLSTQMSQPLTMSAEHMIKHGVVQLDFQQSPDIALFTVLANGELARCLIEPAAQMMAWDRIRLRQGDAVESVAVVPGAARDLIYIVAKRIVGGQTRRFIEVLAENEDDSIASQWYLDSAVEKSGTAFTTVTGLDHLNGEAVKVRYLAAGVPTTIDATVAGGSVTVPSTTYALVGLSYQAKLKTNWIDSVETVGLTKGIGRIFMRLFRSMGFTLKYSDDAAAPSVPVVMTNYTGPKHITTDIPNLVDAALTIVSDAPDPVGIQSIVPEIEIGG